MTPANPTDRAAEVTHPCVRCGTPTSLDRGLCERCNPLGLRDSSSSQVHGTAFLGVVVAVVLLAVFGRTAVAGIGPFPVSIGTVESTANGLAVTLTVTNEGSAAGQTTCRITDPAERGGGPSAYALSPPVEPGETLSFTARVRELGTTVRELFVRCESP